MLHRMTAEEIAIQKIGKLRMISVYEFTGAARQIDDGRNNMKPAGLDCPAGCMAVTVFYGDNEQMTLSELDPYFDELVDRLFYLYSEAPSRSGIMMDTPTRKLFETGRFSEEKSFQKVYAYKKGERVPKISFDSALTRMFMPLLSYLCTEICGFIEHDEKVEDCLYGWHGNGMIVTSIGEKRIEHPVRVLYSDGMDYTVSIGDFPKECENLRVDILLKNAQIDVAFVGEKTDIVGSFIYNFETDFMKVEANVFWEKKQVCYDTQKYQSTKKAEDLTLQERKLMPEGVTPTVIYHLPWNIMYIGSVETKETGDIVKTDFCGTYLFPEAMYSETYYWTRVYNKASKVALKMNSAQMRRLLMKDGTLQTYFADGIASTSGKYRTDLAGRYFLSDIGE